MSTDSPASYYITLGDACVIIAKRESNEMFRDDTISEAKKAYETALDKINKESLKTKTQAKLAALK